MTTLLDILNDPNYVNANAATKRAIFDKHAAQDVNYVDANDITKRAIRGRFGVGQVVAAQQDAIAPSPPSPQDQSFLRSVADVPLGVTKGVASGVRMIADSFGAGSSVAKTISGVEGYLTDLMSAQSKNDAQEIARIQKEAEDKGAWEQVKAAVKAISVAPIDTLSQALGSTAPVIIAGLGATVLGAPLAAAGLVGTGVGAVMGAGTIKGTIFDATKQALMDAKIPEDIATKTAEEVQQYGGKNADQIIYGALLGALGGKLGVEKEIIKSLASRVAGKVVSETAKKEAAAIAAQKAESQLGKKAVEGRGRRMLKAAAEEAGPEFLQAMQEKAAENIALQREGFDVPTMRGVIGAGTFEGLAGAGLGAAISARRVRAPNNKAPTESDEYIRGLDAAAAEFDALAKQTAASPGGIEDEFEPYRRQQAGVVDDTGRGQPSDVVPVPQEGAGRGAAQADVGALDTSGRVIGEPAEGAAEQLRALALNEEAAQNRVNAALDEFNDLLDKLPSVEAQQAASAEVNKLISDAEQAVPANAPDVTKLTVSADAWEYAVAGLRAKVAAAAPAVAKPTVTPEAAVATTDTYAPLKGQKDVAYYFKGERGSIYAHHTDGTTTAFREPSDRAGTGQQTQPRSYKTIYVDDPRSIAPLANPTQLKPSGTGKVARFFTEDYGPHKAGSMVPGTETSFSQTPTVGATPVEVFPNGFEHFGSPITEVVPAAPTAPTTPVAPTAPTAPVAGKINKAKLEEKKAAPAAPAAPAEPKVVETKSASGNPALEITLPTGEVERIEQMADIEGKKHWFYEGTDPSEGRDAIGYVANNASNAIAQIKKDYEAAQAPKRVEGTREPADMRRPISAPIVEYIKNNDFNGMLRHIAQYGGFTGELAGRIAALNLPIDIRFDSQRKLARNWLDLNDAKQNRVFAYIRVSYPEVYAKYFANYHKESDIELVHRGFRYMNSNRAISAAMQKISLDYDAVSDSYKRAAESIAAPASFWTSFNEIAINTEASPTTYHYVLHEAVHAATIALLRRPAAFLTSEQRKARDNLQKMFDYAKEQLKGKELYGFTDLDEFVAELFTNKGFQNELKSIRWGAKNESMYSRFVSAILSFFGLDNVAGAAMLEANKLFSSYRPANVRDIMFVRAPQYATSGPITSNWETAEAAAAKYITRINNIIKGRESWQDVLPDMRKAAWSTGNVMFRKVLLGFANLRQLKDLTQGKIPAIGGVVNVVEQMIADRGMRLKRSADIINRWVALQRKSPELVRRMHRVMLEATIQQKDPDTAKPGDLHPAFHAAWDSLGGPDSEVKQLYRDVRDFYKTSLQEMIAKIKERVMLMDDVAARDIALAKIDKEFGALKGPYFPLRRFGEYSYQVGEGANKKFFMFESLGERDLSFEQTQRRLAAGTPAEQQLAASMYKSNSVADMFNKNSTSEIFKEINRIIDDATSTTTGDLKEELRSSLNQLVYVMLPQQSMKKMFINRKAVQGASEDMLRVFANSAVHTAYQQSRFNYAEDFMFQLSKADDYIKNFVDPAQRDVYDDFVKEIKLRSNIILGTEDTSRAAKFSSAASATTFFFMLSSPFTAMLNTLGFAQFTMPYLGGRYGYAKANGVILNNMKRYLATAPSRTFSPIAGGNTMQMQFPSIVEGGQLKGVLKDAAERFIADGQINLSMTNEAMDLGGMPSQLYTGRLNTVKQIMSGLFHQSERLNREVTLMSTFELAYEKFLNAPQKLDNGVIKRDAEGKPLLNSKEDAFELAIAEAKDIAGLSLGDFSRQFKPRYFTGPIASLLFQFKQYSVMATYAIMRNFALTIGKPFSDAEAAQLRTALEEQYKNAVDKDKLIAQAMAEVEVHRKAVYAEGRKRLAGILGVTFLMSGAEGLPFFSLLGKLLATMFGPGDDEDEFFDWENWFRNYMEENLGGTAGAIFAKLGVSEEKAGKAGRAVGESISRGPLGTITGGALASRTSIDLKNLWYRDGRNSPDIRDSAIEAMIANAGPVVGLGLNSLDAYKLMNEGHYHRAFEKALPALVSKPLTAERFAREGATTKSGVTLVDEFTAWELAMQATGLQPERLAQKQKAAIETKTKEQKILARKTAIMDRLWLERDNPDGFSSAIDDAIEFSARHPGAAIKYETIQESFKKRAKAAQEASALGANIAKKLRPELMDMTAYGAE